MQLRGRHVPVPVVLSAFLLVMLLVVAAVAGNAPVNPPDADAVTDSSSDRGRAAQARQHRKPPPPPPPAPASTRWSGHAFDACRAPSQRVMDRWRTSSPFTGVGIYLGGIHRACEQRHLTPRWVSRQARSGWKLLPIWVGPQASCTGYDHRIVSRPGERGRYGPARARGVAEARRAAAVARSLGLPRGHVLFYDIEPFDTGVTRCRQSSLAFLEEWTMELHRRGYRSGVYSHVMAAISLLSRTGPAYARPDAVWYAWIDRLGSLPREYVADAGFMRRSRVHQYALDTRVSFGGVDMAIDWNFVSLGATSRPTPRADCDQRASRLLPRPVRRGARGPVVQVVKCLVLPGDVHPTKTSGRYDRPTERAVHRFQKRRGLRATGTVDRPTWTSLLARGSTPHLRKGSRGEPVSRLQRTLRVALGRPEVEVDGSFGAQTAWAVRRYRQRVGLRVEPVVTDRVWRAFARGRVVPLRNGPRTR